MKAARRAARFWWEFIVGDDWRIAAGLIAAFGTCALFTKESIAAWWLLPVTAIALLAGSVYRDTRRLPE